MVMAPILIKQPKMPLIIFGQILVPDDAPIGLPNSKWASMSIHYTNGYPSKRQIQSAIRHYNDYGAIMMFDLRDHDVSETMNYFAPYIWEYRTVSWTGTVYPKDY